MAYTDTATVVGIVAAYQAPVFTSAATDGSAPATTVTPPAMIQVTVKLASNGNTFSFQDLESNAAQYIFGTSLPLTIGPAKASS